jgi:hypothetical protein
MSLGAQYVFSEEQYLAELYREEQHTGDGQLSNCAPFALASKSRLASFFGSQQAVDRLWTLVPVDATDTHADKTQLIAGRAQN